MNKMATVHFKCCALNEFFGSVFAISYWSLEQLSGVNNLFIQVNKWSSTDLN